MRKLLQSTLIVTLAFGLMAGKKGKKKKGEEPAPAPAAEAPAPAPEPMAEPVPEPEPEPESVVANADFQATLKRADGTSHSGHVVRVERGEDWYAEKGWTDNKYKLAVTVEGGGTEKDVEWVDIRTIDVSYLGKSSIDCDFDSGYTPLMWTCTMKTSSKVAVADGGSWEAGSRHKWRFTFDDGHVEEFWVNKIPARMQEDTASSINDGRTDELVDPDFQVDLQNTAVEMSQKGVTRIEITPPG